MPDVTHLRRPPLRRGHGHASTRRATTSPAPSPRTTSPAQPSKTSWPARSSSSTTATWSRARWSRSTATRSCSTSASSPRASSPPASCPSATTSTPRRSSRLGDHVEALVLQKEDKEGRLVLSKKRAQYERAWSTIEKLKEADEMVKGPVIEVVKGGLIVDIGLRGFLPASLGRAAPGARAPALRRPEHRGQDHRARPEPQQRRALAPGLAGGGAEGAARRLPGQPQAGRAPQGRRLLGGQLRRLRRPRRHGRPRPRLRAQLEARRPPLLGGRRSATRSRSRCSTSTSTRSGSASR